MIGSIISVLHKKSFTKGYNIKSKIILWVIAILQSITQITL